ncbi:MAG TPA: dienelactone hydrolase family protein [Vicinamibacteria bacterium]|nr:dienelactone hydrolase family protein [Vicinamibacteria bacterium]
MNETGKYDPFLRGSFPVGVRTIPVPDVVRSRIFPCEIWYPAAPQHLGQDLALATQDHFAVPLRDKPRAHAAVRDAASRPGTYPLIVFSHGSAAGARRMSSFLCTHLASHGYVVAALDHFEVVAAADFAPREGETDEQKAARAQAWIANRVPDVRLLLDHLLGGPRWDSEVALDPSRIGIIGYSFGGFTALAATEVDWRLRAVVALAPGGASRPKPGILPATLTFAWGRDVPTLYLAAENDTMTPLEGIRELFERTPATKRMVVLSRADHLHFLDSVEEEHETARTMNWGGKLSWIPKEMRPIADLCSGEEAHGFVRGHALAHMDGALKGQEAD